MKNKSFVLLFIIGVFGIFFFYIIEKKEKKEKDENTVRPILSNNNFTNLKIKNEKENISHEKEKNKEIYFGHTHYKIDLEFLDEEILKIDKKIEDKKLVEKANRFDLSKSELKIFKELLIKRDALSIAKIRKMIKAI